MVMYRPERRSRERVGFMVDKVVTVAFAAAISGWPGGSAAG
jgi:hypothetical protein